MVMIRLLSDSGPPMHPRILAPSLLFFVEGGTFIRTAAPGPPPWCARGQPPAREIAFIYLFLVKSVLSSSAGPDRGRISLICFHSGEQPAVGASGSNAFSTPHFGPYRVRVRAAARGVGSKVFMAAIFMLGEASRVGLAWR